MSGIFIDDALVAKIIARWKVAHAHAQSADADVWMVQYDHDIEILLATIQELSSA